MLQPLDTRRHLWYTAPMILRIEIHVPYTQPNSPEAVAAVDRIEALVTAPLASTGWAWWINVENGETRYKPENVSELS